MSGLQADMWVKIPEDSPFDWATGFPDYGLHAIPGYYIKGLKGYQVTSEENLKKLAEEQEQEEDDGLENYGEKKDRPVETIPYNPVRATRTLRFGKQFKLGVMMVQDFYGHTPQSNRFGFDTSNPPVNGAYKTLFDILFFLMNSEIPSYYLSQNPGLAVQGYNTYDVRSYMIEAGWPAVRGCINAASLVYGRDFVSQLILEGISGQKFGNKVPKWTKWYEANKNGTLPERDWPPTREGQAARLVWEDLIADRWENADPLFASAIREVPELATPTLMEALASDNLLGALNASTLVSGLDDPAFAGKLLKTIEKKPHAVRIRVVRRLLSQGSPAGYLEAAKQFKTADALTFKVPYLDMIGAGNRPELAEDIIALMKKNVKDEAFKEVGFRALAGLVRFDPSIVKKSKAVKPRSDDCQYYARLMRAMAGDKGEAKKCIAKIQGIASSPRRFGISTGEVASTVTISLHHGLALLARHPEPLIRKHLWKVFVTSKNSYASTVVAYLDFDELPDSHKKDIRKWAKQEGLDAEFRASCLKRILEDDKDEACEIANGMLKYAVKNARKDDTNIAHLLIAVGLAGWRGDDSDRAALKSMAKTDEFHPLLRSESLTQLCHFPDELDEAWLVNAAYNDKLLPIRRIAMRAMGLTRTPKALSTLVDLITHEEPTIRFTALYSLEHATGKAHWCDVWSKEGKDKQARKKIQEVFKSHFQSKN